MEVHEKFILALNAKKKIQVNYHDEGNRALVERKCIPLDYCEYKKENSKEEGFCFRMWDCQEGKELDASIKDNDIETMEILDEAYEMEEYKNNGFCGIKYIITLFVLLGIAALLVALFKFL